MLDNAGFGGATIEDKVEKKTSIAGRVGLVAAALAVAGGGAFAVTQALSEPAGAQSPEEAVAQLFEAVENDDLIGLTESLLPSEREALIEPMTDLFSELERLEILDEDVDLESRTDEAGSDGLDFSVTGLDFTTTTIGEGVVNVQLNAGVVTVAGDVGDLPFGDRASAELGEENMAESLDEQIVDFSNEPDAQLTVVEEDGSWYFSIWYSVAELAREEAGEPVPNFDQGVQPTGADTPEGAMQLMMNAATALDVEGVIATMDPSEFRALHDYAPLFLDDADEAVAEFRQMLADEGITWSLDRLDLSSADVRGRTVVSVDGFAASAESASLQETFSVDYNGDCFTIVNNSAIDEVCLSELRNEMAGQDVPEAYLDLVQNSTSGVTVIERDGQWYISGFPTIIGAYTDLLASLEPSDIDDLADFFTDSVEDAFELGDPFFDELSGNDDPFAEFDTIDDDPFFEDFPEEEEGYDPFAEENEGFTQPALTPEDAALYPDGWTVQAYDATTAYFGGAIGITPVSYTEGYLDFGPIMYIERFDATAAELNAGMAETFSYVEVQVDGLPAGATAWDWEGVDRAVVIDGFIISAYFLDDGSAMTLLNERVNAIANG